MKTTVVETGGSSQPYFRTTPNKSEITNNTMNMKNSTLAIAAAPAAIPPKPKTAAMRATIKNNIVQRNISVNFDFTFE